MSYGGLQGLEDPSSNRALVQEKVREFLRGKGLRITDSRSWILEEIYSRHSHFTAAELCERLKKEGRPVSQMTIYRMLKLLVESEYLVSLDLGGNEQQYDPNYSTSPGHHHIRCKDCGELIEFDDPCLDLRERALTEKMGFKADTVVFRVEATCEELRTKGECRRREESPKALRGDR